MWQLMFDDFGDLEMVSVQCVSSRGESTNCIVGASRVLGEKGILENRIDYTYRPCLKSLSNL